MVKAAAVIPHDCIIREKSLATAGATLRARVITGKATAPPPSLVIPKGKIKKTFFLCSNLTFLMWIVINY